MWSHPKTLCHFVPLTITVCNTVVNMIMSGNWATTYIWHKSKTHYNSEPKTRHKAQNISHITFPVLTKAKNKNEGYPNRNIQKEQSNSSHSRPRFRHKTNCSIKSEKKSVVSKWKPWEHLISNLIYFPTSNQNQKPNSVTKPPKTDENARL